MRARRSTNPESTATASALDRPLASLKGIGPARAAALAAAGLRTTRDLLLHLPRRLVPLPHATPIERIVAGRDVAAVGRVSRIVPSRRRGGAAQVFVEDGTGAIALVFFGQPHAGSAFERGMLVYAAGRAGARAGKAFLAVSTWDVVAEGETRPAAARAVYDLPNALPPRTHRRLVAELAPAALELDDWRTAAKLPLHELIPLQHAIAALHVARDENVLAAARRRLAADELVAQLLPLALARAQVDATRKPAAVRVDARACDALWAALPFAPTRAQRRVLDEVLADLAAPRPMHRLVHGDVGSGKTAVALLAAAAAVRAGHQAALLAPTALLAQQHAAVATRLLAPLAIPIATLTAATPARERGATIARLRAREAMLLIGTHALLGERVALPALRLAIVDEQHRFGVFQRAKLRAKAQGVDLLVMSATPIPRTLALAVFGDLDVSAIDELPPGRVPVRTEVVERKELRAVVEDVGRVARAGGRVFVVCPLVEDSEAKDVAAAETLARKLAAHFRGAPQVALAHGRRKREENARALEAFRAGLAPVLVATVVVEVGVDVPEATLMVVLDAERFGLAALHQLRGRVGRGASAARCVLVARGAEPVARARLDALVHEHDGLAIAQKDLELRGMGQLAGARQHGIVDLRFADLARDVDLLAQAQADLRAAAAAGRIDEVAAALRGSAMGGLGRAGRPGETAPIGPG